MLQHRTGHFSNRIMKRILTLLIVFSLIGFEPSAGQNWLGRDRPVYQKLLYGSLESLGIQAASTGILLLSPTDFSGWHGKPLNSWGANLKRAYSSPPVWDQDHWVINYLGHPYMGAWYYNSVRSQGCSLLTSAGMCIGQTLMWEYFLEAGFEQPSINDLIVTPLAGIVIGEAIHRLTLHLRKGGYTPWEKVLIIAINPLFVINNGLKNK